MVCGLYEAQNESGKDLKLKVGCDRIRLTAFVNMKLPCYICGSCFLEENMKILNIGAYRENFSKTSFLTDKGNHTKIKRL